MQFIRPKNLAYHLGVTTNALKKQRQRGTGKYEYEVVGGKVFYIRESLPPSVRDNLGPGDMVPGTHETNKSPRYWNSIGRVNEQRRQRHRAAIKACVRETLAEERVREAAQRNVTTTTCGSRSLHDYVRWVDPFEPVQSKPRKKNTGPYY